MGKRKKKWKSKEEPSAAIWPEDGLCPLCGRPMVPGPSLNEHHLIPKSRGGRLKHVLHRVCHSKIHSVFNENELARAYNTFEKLQQHPEIRKFIAWVRKQDVEANFRNRAPRV